MTRIFFNAKESGEALERFVERAGGLPVRALACSEGAIGTAAACGATWCVRESIIAQSATPIIDGLEVEILL